MLRRHAPDVVSLVFGTLFAGFAVIWLLNATDVIDYQEAWLAGPAILIVAGILGLVIALRPSQPAEPPPPWAVPPREPRDMHEIPPASDAASEPTTSIEAEPTREADAADSAETDRSDNHDQVDKHTE